MDDRADDPQTVAAIGDSFIPQPAQSITMEDRAGDPQTVAAIRDSFNSLLDQNKPDKSYVMERDTYDYYLSALLQRSTNRVFAKLNRNQEVDFVWGSISAHSNRN